MDIEYEIALAEARYNWIKECREPIPKDFDRFYKIGWDNGREFEEVINQVVNAKPFLLPTDAAVLKAMTEDNLNWKWKNNMGEGS